MARGRGAEKKFAVSVLVVGLLASPALRADLKVEEKLTVERPGGRGRAAEETTATTWISGEKARAEVDRSLPAAGLRRSSRSGDDGRSVVLTRLDRKTSYRVNPRSRSYTETSFESAKALRDERSKARESRRSSEGEDGSGAFDCGDLRVVTKKTGATEERNGFPAEQVRIEGVRSCVLAETRDACETFFTIDAWVTPMTPAFEELRGFRSRRAKLLEIGSEGEELLERAGATPPPRIAEDLPSLFAELAKVPGFPVRAAISVEREGFCQVKPRARSPEAEAPDAGATASEPTNLADSLKQANAKKRPRPKPVPEKPSSEGSPDGAPPVAGTSSDLSSGETPSSPRPPEGTAAAEVERVDPRERDSLRQERLDRMADGKRDARRLREDGEAGSRRKVFGLTTEVSSLSAAPVSAEVFELPRDYRKVDPAKRAAPGDSKSAPSAKGTPEPAASAPEESSPEEVKEK